MSLSHRLSLANKRTYNLALSYCLCINSQHFLNRFLQIRAINEHWWLEYMVAVKNSVPNRLALAEIRTDAAEIKFAAAMPIVSDFRFIIRLCHSDGSESNSLSKHWNRS